MFCNENLHSSASLASYMEALSIQLRIWQWFSDSWIFFSLLQRKIKYLIYYHIADHTCILAICAYHTLLTYVMTIYNLSVFNSFSYLQIPPFFFFFCITKLYLNLFLFHFHHHTILFQTHKSSLG